MEEQRESEEGEKKEKKRKITIRIIAERGPDKNNTFFFAAAKVQEVKAGKHLGLPSSSEKEQRRPCPMCGAPCGKLCAWLAPNFGKQGFFVLKKRWLRESPSRLSALETPQAKSTQGNAAQSNATPY